MAKRISDRQYQLEHGRIVIKKSDMKWYELFFIFLIFLLMKPFSIVPHYCYKPSQTEFDSL